MPRRSAARPHLRPAAAEDTDQPGMGPGIGDVLALLGGLVGTFSTLRQEWRGEAASLGNALARRLDLPTRAELSALQEEVAALRATMAAPAAPTVTRKTRRRSKVRP